jgi:cell division inhibitor SepF
MGLFSSFKDKFIVDPSANETEIFTGEGSNEGGYPGDDIENINDGINQDDDADLGMGGSIELKVVKPERYSNVQQIADHLINHRTVVLNLESTNKETAKRLLDFLSGVAYSIGGQLKRVASNTFVITPPNVDVSGEQMRNAAGEDTSNFTTTFGITDEAKAENNNSDSLF